MRSTHRIFNGEIMKPRNCSYRHRHPALEWANHACYLLDHFSAPLATATLFVGIIAVALQLGLVADYIFAAGLLLHLLVWFDAWRRPARRRHAR